MILKQELSAISSLLFMTEFCYDCWQNLQRSATKTYNETNQDQADTDNNQNHPPSNFETSCLNGGW